MPAPTNQDPRDPGSSAHFVTYVGAIVDTDLQAEGGAACKRIRANLAGALVVKRASDNALVTLNFLAGETQEVNCLALVAAGSGVVGCTVYW